MDENIRKEIGSRWRNSLQENLGMEVLSASGERVEITMPVDARTQQGAGILHGGASLALAETVAGLGSLVACQPDETIVGTQVSGNHVAPALNGDIVRAVGTIIHCGKTMHVWNVDIFRADGQLVSTARVVNNVLKKK
ncbi:hypothetical protein FACS189430_08290 [Bacteroidia bacterium]|nr:hypothetical protein FACS189430_08290 [Bacteroidia bacterium]